ncbi:winged helix-turn-helix domain-containing protein [Patiriisocius hiemis]|uniref:Winged helix-turn-helix domain-containing protein n=1 Tax=Patiriisocius hiemis TaxID=3075604 RepID=A0ABU2YAL9_9FLAO|nr:winged helix-turn-helix domain-containing protein [Constantimarinum sp. W242]MDT0554835.1 winged helix-turn-helix domain-containing protein [Constantimarinum sp. W242]
MRTPIVFILLFFLFVNNGNSQEAHDFDFDKRVKVALREAGNHLLLSQGDSTSIITPVKKLDNQVYKLSFNNVLSFDPANLSNALEKSLMRVGIEKNYLVEVKQCENTEITYSYQTNFGEENVLIPCGGREVPQSCYEIFVEFSENNSLPVEDSKSEIIFYILVASVLLFLAFVFYSKYYWYKNKEENTDVTALGIFQFYPEQNKLIKEAEEITLTNKESELLEILVARPNEVVKREELTKKVWEDNGVIVGRSLDTYISKLRKKLQEDKSIKITNVHGVGYKLEVV